MFMSRIQLLVLAERQHFPLFVSSSLKSTSDRKQVIAAEINSKQKKLSVDAVFLLWEL